MKKEEEMAQKRIIIMLKDELEKTQKKLQTQKARCDDLEETSARLKSCNDRLKGSLKTRDRELEMAEFRWANNMQASREKAAKRERGLKKRNENLERALEDRERELRTGSQKLKAALQLLDEETRKREVESDRRAVCENKLQVQKARCYYLEETLATLKRCNDRLKGSLKARDRELEMTEFRWVNNMQLIKRERRTGREKAAKREQDISRFKKRNEELELAVENQEIVLRTRKHRSEVALRLLGEETRKRVEVEADLRRVSEETKLWTGFHIRNIAAQGGRGLLAGSRALSSRAFRGQLVREQVRRASLGSVLDGHDRVEIEERTVYTASSASLNDETAAKIAALILLHLNGSM